MSSVMSSRKKKCPSKRSVSLIYQEVSESYFCRGVKSGNEKFSRDIAAWTFQESLVLRIDRTEHHRVNTTEPLEQYTTNDQLVSFVLVPPYVILTPSLNLGVQYLHLKIQCKGRHMGTFFWVERPSTRIYHAWPSHPYSTPTCTWCSREILRYVPCTW